MIDLVGVLPGTVVLAQERLAVERLVLEHFDSFAAAGLIFARLRHRPQLTNLVLQR